MQSNRIWQHVRRLSPSNKFKHPISMSHTTHRDLFRSRLRQLAAWIRDMLDPLIAREGPDISATTLRATRIHRAIMEVAGKATRWPSRLADECDKVLWIWRERFGSLEALRPFLYCRGGRLETVAGIGDVTRAALLKRWMDTHPELMSLGRSRRHGDLGFQPGTYILFPYAALLIMSSLAPLSFILSLRICSSFLVVSVTTPADCTQLVA